MIQININKCNWLLIKLVVTHKVDILHIIKLPFNKGAFNKEVFNKEVVHNNLDKHNLVKHNSIKLLQLIKQVVMQELINNKILLLCNK